MIKISIYAIGKTKELWLEQALEEYIKRLKSNVTIEWIWAKDNEHLIELTDKRSDCICLDPKGTLLTSEDFAKFLDKQWTQFGSKLAFIIGGPEGLPDTLKKRFPLISLSTLTMTHQLIRLVLIEQLYRAIEILKGSKYHK